MKRIFSFVSLSSFVMLFFASNAWSAPKSKLIPYWNVFAQEQTVEVDHSTWQGFLDKYLVVQPGDANLVKYGKVSDEDKSKLNEYLNYLASLDPFLLTKKQQYAYWLNIYNAITVDLVVEKYPTDSIRDLGAGFFSFGPWNDELITIKGKELTLNNIEHGILRPIWQDARVHYLVNCASIGCPSLSDQAFTKDNVESQAIKAAVEFINSERGVSLNAKKNTLILSSIFDWFQEDFGNSEEGVLEHITNFANPELKEKLEGFSGSIDYEYDWSLNVSPY